MKKRYFVLFASIAALLICFHLNCFAEFSGIIEEVDNTFLISPCDSPQPTSLVLDANGGTFEDCTPINTYKQDVSQALVLYANGGTFENGSSVKKYRANTDTLTLDANGGKFTDGAKIKRYKKNKGD